MLPQSQRTVCIKRFYQTTNLDLVLKEYQTIIFKHIKNLLFFMMHQLDTEINDWCKYIQEILIVIQLIIDHNFIFRLLLTFS